MGWPKALLPWPATGAPIVRHVTDRLRESGVGPIAVVTGHHHDRMAPVLAACDVAILHNPRHDEGQLSSLLCGLEWAFAQTSGDWALVALVDVPAVRSATITRLIDETRAGGWLAVRPAYGHRHGHPVLWHRDTLARLEGADPALGARPVMRGLAAEGRVRDVEVDDEGVCRDIDTPEDYAALVVPPPRR